MIHHVIDGVGRGIHDQIGFGVRVGPLLQEKPDSLPLVPSPEHRPILGRSDPRHDRVGIRRQRDDDTAPFQRLQVSRIHDRAAPGGHDAARSTRDPFHHAGLESPERGFSLRGEDLGDRHARFGGDQRIQVEEIVPQHDGEASPDGGFPRRHETAENDVSLVSGHACRTLSFEELRSTRKLRHVTQPVKQYLRARCTERIVAARIGRTLRRKRTTHRSLALRRRGDGCGDYTRTS